MELLEGRHLLATIAVTGTGDSIAVDGVVTLREAIISANNNANLNADVVAVGTYGADTITLPAGTYTLAIAGAGEDAAASGDLDITGSLTINGAGAATTIIQAGTTTTNGVDRVLDIFGDGLTVNISGVTIRNGNRPGTGQSGGADSGEGGGIFIHGSSEPLAATNVSITDSVIQDNTAGLDGGGISNISRNASIVLTRVTVTGNHALGRDGGGIIHVPDAGDLTLTDSTVSNNTAGRQTGGVFVGGGFTNNLIVTGSTISNNTAVDGIGGIEFDPNDGDLTITRSTISGNNGGSEEVGGILFGIESGDMLITDSTISGNTSGDNGGGLELNDDDGTMTIVNSTISGNRSGTNGGGIHVSGSSPLTLTNVTITGNTADNDDNLSGDGGGIFATSTVNLLNTIVAGNTDTGGQAPDISGTLTSQGHNLIQSTAGATIVGSTVGNILGQNPLLGVLASNGGPTQTHALLAGSPAIDAGDDAVVGAPLSLATDQRGSGFPRLVGAHVDIGAFEAGIAPPEGGLPTCDITTRNEPGAPGSAVLQTDADTEESNVLLVTGTSRNDVIIIEPRPVDPTQIRVKINGHLAGIFASSDVPRIVSFGLNGNDTIVVNATLTQSATLFGGNGNDFLYGGAGSDQLEGDAGNDHLFGLAGDDALCGGDGNDFLYGGLGNDTLFGEAGNDRMFGETGDDLLIAGDGNDFVYGGIGNDQLYGQGGNDQLFGDPGNDIVVGGDGNDKLFGSTGRDLLIGGTGADQLFGEAHDDILIAGSTTFDESQDALSAILAEWTSGNDYLTRINNLRTGGGASGGVTLDGTTVLDDGAVDTLWGQGEQDWFLIGSHDKIKDRAVNELVN